MKQDRLSRRIDKSAKDLMRARREKGGFWHYAYVLGVGGWLFVIPVVGGAYLGRYLDRKLEDGISWTITLMLIGIAVGAYNVWYFYMREK